METTEVRERFTRYELKVRGIRGRDRKPKTHYLHGMDLPEADLAAGEAGCKAAYAKVAKEFKSVERVEYAERPAERTTYPDGVKIVAAAASIGGEDDK